jgi:cytochrome c oxidase subunit 2
MLHRLKKIMIIFLAQLFWGPQAFGAFPTPWQIGFQESASPIMDRILELHNGLMIVICVIAAVVTALLGYVMFRYSAKRQKEASQTTHHTLLEIVWTAIPALIVVFIAVPSVKLIYFTDAEPKEAHMIKVIGHQWYWTYEYPDHDIKFDSYMIEDKDIKPGQIRLLEVDNRIIVPVGKPICLQITSADVLHSWAVPALGVKKDAVTGRLNQTWVQVDKPGVYFGQCSEICGMKHGFMPIVIEAVSQEEFDAWIQEAKQKFAMLSPQTLLAMNPAALVKQAPQV